MTELLSKLFVKNYKDTNNDSVRKSYGTLASVVGIIVNFILAFIKLLVGALSSSVAIIADAFNNLSDAGSSVITLISFKISSKPADKGHPFGHARMEYICSMIVSFLILLVGVELLVDSIKTILGLNEGAATEVTPLTIIVLSISILIKLWLGVFYNKVGKKISSSVVKAAATDSLSDSISTLAVLASSLIIKYIGWQLADAIVGIAVSMLILLAGIRILNETKNALLGEAPVEETVKAVKDIVAEFPEVIGMHDLMVHNYGPHHFIASFHAEVDGKSDIYHLHDVIDNVERKIKDELNILCTVHMDPIVTDDEECNELKAFLVETLEENGLSLSIHDFRTVIGETHTNMIFDVELPFDNPMNEDEVKEKICAAVHEKRHNCYCVITVDRA